MRFSSRSTTPAILAAWALASVHSTAEAATAVSPADWSYETIDEAQSPFLRPLSAIAIDSSGAPHVIFSRKYSDSFSPGALYHASQVDDSWVVSKIAECDECNRTPDASFDELGQLHLAYRDDNRLIYGKSTSSGWQFSQIPTPGISIGVVSLTASPTGQPHVAFAHNSSLGVGYYATLEGDDWDLESIENSFTPWSIALDNQGQPVVAGYSNQTLRVATRESTGWASEFVDRGGLGASLAIDSFGVIHVGHTVINDDDLRYATKNNGKWNTEVVQYLGPGPAGPSLALGPNGSPRMSYEINISGSVDQVVHAYRGEDQWFTSIVDPQRSFESGTSLAVDNSGRSHIVYSNQSRDLRYATALIVPEPYAQALLLLMLGPAILARRQCARRRPTASAAACAPTA